MSYASALHRKKDSDRAHLHIEGADALISHLSEWFGVHIDDIIEDNEEQWESENYRNRDESKNELSDVSRRGEVISGDTDRGGWKNEK